MQNSCGGSGGTASLGGRKIGIDIEIGFGIGVKD